MKTQAAAKKPLARPRVAKPRGRPRCFDTGKALDAAMDVFWRKGYEGASLSDLTRAMKINRPSLYAAFGDKESLFRQVLDRYEEGQVAAWGEALRQPTARAVAEAVLTTAIRLTTQPDFPKGCLLIQGGLACGEGAECAAQEMARRRREIETLLRHRLDEARSEGDLPAEADPAALARYITTVMRGIAIQAADGASAEELSSVRDAALRAWPA